MEYLTIAEFAEKVGVSKQAIYQRIKKGGLQEFITTENGTAKISENALELFAQNKFAGGDVKIAHNAPETHETQEKESGECLSVQTLNGLQEIIGTLQAVIDSQAEEIKQKTEMLNERDAQISKYASKFAELAQNALQTAVQAQTLHAVSESEKIINKAQNEPQNTTEDSVAEKQKTNWFKDLFKRNSKG